MNLNMRWRVLAVVATLAVSLFLLWPTWQYYRLSPEQLAGMDPAEVAEMKSQALRLGLDLQGGTHMVLELDDSEAEEPTDDLMDRALEIIRNRVDQFGVSEPVVQRAGENRIIVELAGVDIADATDLINRAAVLEFKMVRPGSEVRRLVERMDREISRIVGVETAAAEETETEEPAVDADSADVTQDIDDGSETADAAVEDDASQQATSDGQLARFLEDDAREMQGRPLASRITLTQRQGRVAINEICFVREADFEKVNGYLEYLADPGGGRRSILPEDVEWLWGSDVLTDATGSPIRYLYLLNRRAELTGERLETARAQPDMSSNISGNFMVEFDLDRRGRRMFSRTTGENVGRLMAIVLDNRVQSAPEIESKIRAGTASITGRFTAEEAAKLSIVLRAGALPAEIRVEEQRAIGPSLGHDSIDMGRRAILFGFVGVLIFMIIYYRAAGGIAAFALLLNLVLMLAALVSIGAVLTLPGIAGFVLTVGMAVDANVLIFERIREELRQGQTFRNAVSRGYDRAFRTIFDANLTTLFAALALLWFGTGPIKGFAVTLSIGVVVSMFTALFVTRVVFDLLTRGARVGRVAV